MIWLNGRLVEEAEAAISPQDRGFTLADGVFETMRDILWLPDHLARLRQGAAVLGIALPFDDATIAVGLAALLADARLPEAALRLTVTRGPSTRRGLWPADDLPRTTVMATVAPLPTASPGLRLIIARTTRRNEHSPLSRIKSLNYGDNLLARREAVARGADDAIMLNGQGRAACGTVANLFLRLGDHWVTPPSTEGVLPGLARRRLIGRLGAVEAALTESDIVRAEAAILSNSLHCTIVTDIDGRRLSDRPLDLATLYA